MARDADWTPSLQQATSGVAAADGGDYSVAAVKPDVRPNSRGTRKDGVPRSGSERKANAQDQAYIIDLCDRVLGMQALREYGKFSFLTGDPGRQGAGVKLRVDAYYSSLKLVIEYHERQHSEAVAMMDARMTASGCTRGEQRRRYDERRREMLPANGVTLIELDYRSFTHDKRGRLQRDEAADKPVIRSRLSEFLSRRTSHAS